MARSHIRGALYHALSFAIWLMAWDGGGLGALPPDRSRMVVNPGRAGRFTCSDESDSQDLRVVCQMSAFRPAWRLAQCGRGAVDETRETLFD
jgi:hypothetical protein